MREISRFIGLAIAAALVSVVGIPAAMANDEQPAEDTVTIIVRGHPYIYCGNETDDSSSWPIITRLENVPRNATFKDVKDRLPVPKSLPGYVFNNYYSKSKGGTGSLLWNDDDALVDDKGYIRQIHYPYHMTAALGYETHGADNAEDPAFDWYTIPEYNNMYKYKIPTVNPVRSNSEPGRSADTFLGWFKDEGLTEPATESDSVRQEWAKLWKEMKEQGQTEYPQFEDPDNPGCMRGVKAVVIHAGWDEAPLLEVQDVTITEGDDFDLNSLVKSATDTEDETPTVSFDSQPDSATPGTYTVNVTATDSKGATHTLPATLTVLPKASVINKVPTLEVKNVTITVGDSFTPADVVVSVSDEEDAVAGKEPTVTYSGDYDVNTPGTYPITVKATDADGASTTKTAALTVLPKASVINKAPTLEVKDVTITVGEDFTPTDLVESYGDEEDEKAGVELTLTFSGRYDTNVPGTYSLGIKVTDSAGASITKTANLIVKAAQKPNSPNNPKVPANPQKPGGGGSVVTKTVLAKTGLNSTSVAFLALGCTLAGLGAVALRRREH